MAIEHCLASDDAVVDFGWLAEAGRSYTRNVTIRNECEHDIEVSGALLGEYGKIDGSVDAASNAADWLAFVGGENHFSLGAKASKTISIRNYVPAAAGAKSYYAQVSFRNESSEQHDEEFPDVLKIDTRMDIAGGESSVLAGKLEKNSLRVLNFGGKIKNDVYMTSEGSYGYLAHYKLEKSQAFGIEDFETIVEKDFEVAGNNSSMASIEEVEANANHYGIYKLRQTVQYVNGDGNRAESVLTQTVVNLPWVTLFILGGALFALLLLMIISKAIKYHKKAKKEDEEEEEKLEDEIEAEKKEEKEKLERPEPKPAKVIRKEKKEAKRAEKAKKEKKNKKSKKAEAEEGEE